MKGLLLKDLMMMLKYGRLTLLACLIFSLVGWFGEPNLFMMLYPVMSRILRRDGGRYVRLK